MATPKKPKPPPEETTAKKPRAKREPPPAPSEQGSAATAAVCRLGKSDQSAYPIALQQNTPGATGNEGVIESAFTTAPETVLTVYADKAKTQTVETATIAGGTFQEINDHAWTSVHVAGYDANYSYHNVGTGDFAFAGGLDAGAVPDADERSADAQFARWFPYANPDVSAPPVADSVIQVLGVPKPPAGAD